MLRPGICLLAGFSFVSCPGLFCRLWLCALPCAPGRKRAFPHLPSSGLPWKSRRRSLPIHHVTSPRSSEEGRNICNLEGDFCSSFPSPSKSFFRIRFGAFCEARRSENHPLQSRQSTGIDVRPFPCRNATSGPLWNCSDPHFNMIFGRLPTAVHKQVRLERPSGPRGPFGLEGHRGTFPAFAIRAWTLAGV